MTLTPENVKTLWQIINKCSFEDLTGIQNACQQVKIELNREGKSNIMKGSNRKFEVEDG